MLGMNSFQHRKIYTPKIEFVSADNIFKNINIYMK